MSLLLLQHNQTSYENIVLLLHTQLRHALGKNQKQWYKVLNITDLVENRNAGNSSLPIDLHNHEEFHNLRKYLRAFWRVMSQYPQTIPMMFYPMTLGEGKKGAVALADIEGMLNEDYRLSDNRTVMQALFANDVITVGLLSNQ